MSQKQWPCGYKSKCPTQNQHLRHRQANRQRCCSLQLFLTAALLLHCLPVWNAAAVMPTAHSHPAEPSWVLPDGNHLRACLGIRIFPTWMQKSQQKKTGSIYAVIRTLRICEWNAQAEWNNIWQIIWKASWLNKERTEQLCRISRTGNSKHY